MVGSPHAFAHCYKSWLIVLAVVACQEVSAELGSHGLHNAMSSVSACMKKDHVPDHIADTQKNFQISVAGVADIPGATPDPFISRTNATIYDGTVNGVSGYDVNIRLSVPPTTFSG